MGVVKYDLDGGIGGAVMVFKQRSVWGFHKPVSKSRDGV